MRKYIKGTSESNNNSVLFQEAKRRFHYQPSNSHRFGLHSKTKQLGHQFKEQYSSVKDIKNDNNEINESSWIAKLVNGIQEHSSGDQPAKIDSMQKNSNCHLAQPSSALMNVQPYSIVVQGVKQPLTRKNSGSITNVPTKKNSLNVPERKKGPADVVKVKAKTKKDKQNSPDTVYKNKSQSKFKTNNQPNQKSSVSLKRNRSQSIIATSQSKIKKEQTSKNCKSVAVKNLNQVSKDNINLVNQENFFSFKSTEKSEKPMQTIKINKQKDSKNSSNIILQEAKRRRLSESLNQMQEISGPINKQIQNSLDSVHHKFDLILDDDLAEPLFKNTTADQQSQSKNNQQIQRKTHFGSIKKNKTVKNCQEKTFSNDAFRKEASLTFARPHQLEGIISERAIQEDIVTAREEKILIDNFKSHKLLNQKQKNGTTPTYLMKVEPKLQRRYCYNIQSNISQIPDIQAPTLRDNLQHKNNRSIKFNQQVFTSVNSHLESNRSQYPSQRQSNQKYSYGQLQNKQNQFKYSSLPEVNFGVANILTRKNSIAPVAKSTSLSRQAYLMESSNTVTNQSIVSSHNVAQFSSAFKKPISSGPIPTKYSYLTMSSGLQQTDRFGNFVYFTQQKQNKTQAVQGRSDVLIDRLNSKLNCYIKQHQLQQPSPFQQQPIKQGEPTHRLIHLTFSELKKHSQLYRQQ